MGADTWLSSELACLVVLVWAGKGYSRELPVMFPRTSQRPGELNKIEQCPV